MSVHCLISIQSTRNWHRGKWKNNNKKKERKTQIKVTHYKIYSCKNEIQFLKIHYTKLYACN